MEINVRWIPAAIRKDQNQILVHNILRNRCPHAEFIY